MSRRDKASATTFFCFFPGRYSNVTPYSSRSKSQRKTRSEALKPLKVLFLWSVKTIHARAYTVTRSVEQQLQQSKEIVRLVDIVVLEEDYSSEWASPSFAIPKKNGESTISVVTDFRKLNLLLKHCVSPISYSKDWES
jgi:hypothetical protein